MDHPIIEEAINYGVDAMGQRCAMAIQIAYFWVEGWLAGGGNGTVTADEAREIREAVRNYHFE